MKWLLLMIYFWELMMRINFNFRWNKRALPASNFRRLSVQNSRSIYYKNKKIIKKIIVECVSYIEAIIILMYNNQPTKFQIKIHNGRKKKKKKKRNEKKFILWFSSSFFLCCFISLLLSLSYSLTHSLHCFILHIIFHFYFPRQKIDILKTFILSSTLVILYKWKMKSFFLHSYTHKKKKWDFHLIFFKDNFNSNYMDILIIYLCIFH